MEPLEYEGSRFKEKGVSPVTTLLSHRILNLMLRPDAPFPSQTRDSHEFIKAWRTKQRLRLLARPDDLLRDRDSTDPDSPADLGGDER